jgi:hypothetical protein
MCKGGNKKERKRAKRRGRPGWRGRSARRRDSDAAAGLPGATARRRRVRGGAGAESKGVDENFHRQV